MGINDIVQIGNTIKKLRIEKGLTQKEMADKLGIPPTTYSNYENNHREPNKEILEKICEMLKVTPNQLIVIASFESEVNVRNKYIEKIESKYNENKDDELLMLIKGMKEYNLITEHTSKKLSEAKRYISKNTAKRIRKGTNALNKLLEIESEKEIIKLIKEEIEGLERIKKKLAEKFIKEYEKRKQVEQDTEEN